ncbi:MAG TPA: STAS domain-containing protein [Microbacteriaceae bacterium]|jgi:anti-anti-sigma factor|nr:STAS domain-containing protein [Microbacteriaceae bacterium]
MEANNPPLNVELLPGGGSPYSAVVTLCGEHDLATSREVNAALAPLHGRVLLDLSRCTFIDSAVLASVLRKFQDSQRSGQGTVELVVKAGSSVDRLLEVTGVRQLLVVHSSMPAGTNSDEDSENAA